ncbi:DUF742 domain-containing protein [Micromonospora sp. NPDC093277]|uniref:DUF742 domain-containing protein n=1 Tax=Micromonospora sp. NPDC093277 TaxID=3364291 RepID=UPI003829A18D
MPAEAAGPRHEWLDAAAGPVVRPYTLTGGRVRPLVGGVDLVAFVRATTVADTARLPGLQPEHRSLVELARRPAALADLAADLDLAVGVVRVLIGDLLARGLVAVHQPSAAAHLPDDNILKAVVNGLRAL